MSGYTVFELTGDDTVARGQEWRAAFTAMCVAARMRPVFERLEDSWTVLSFVDTTDLGRDLEPRRARHHMPAAATRELMLATMSEGLCGFYAVPDEAYDADLRKWLGHQGNVAVLEDYRSEGMTDGQHLAAMRSAGGAR